MSGKGIMPVLFVGHGNPMNAIENNEFSSGWEEAAKKLPEPEAILCVSAHWESWGTQATGPGKLETIHDFGGFPQALYGVQYRARGSAWLSGEIKKLMGESELTIDDGRGLDHGCWSVLSRMYPGADIPVAQLSLDQSKSGINHYETAKRLMSLRQKGVLIIGSGNMVHNLYKVRLKGEDFNQEYGFDWANRASALFKKLIINKEDKKLCGYESLGKDADLAIPTPEHFLPLLYVIALRQPGDSMDFFNDKAVAGSLTMTSFVLGA
jgi:4,5-DOPA dioxygenase extradiol